MRTTEYITWSRMKDRCHNPNAHNYKYYGGRGITVCDEWRNSFTEFLKHVGKKPSPQHSIDRINNDGNYEPGNVRWATKQEQQANTRVRARAMNNARFARTRAGHLSGEARHTFRGILLPPGLSYHTIYQRVVKHGWTVEEALTKESRLAKKR